jgi:protein-S-isoprenylcysteine O-methyltransferase Ste14
LVDPPVSKSVKSEKKHNENKKVAGAPQGRLPASRVLPYPGHSTKVRLMSTDSIVMIVSIVVWLAAEAHLMLKDHTSGKGTTDIDRRTRNYNTIATVTSLTLGLVLNWVVLLRFGIQRTSVFLWIGIVVMLFGFVLRHWSIISLGKYFRTTTELENGQKVIDQGPYRYIRHPSYAGIIIFFIGYGLISENWISLGAAICLPIASLVYRIHVEEKVLAEGIGPEHVDYQQRTKKLIPSLW